MNNGFPSFPLASSYTSIKYCQYQNFQSNTINVKKFNKILKINCIFEKNINKYKWKTH